MKENKKFSMAMISRKMMKKIFKKMAALTDQERFILATDNTVEELRNGEKNIRVWIRGLDLRPSTLMFGSNWHFLSTSLSFPIY